MQGFTEDVIHLIASIPPGKVMSYGAIAQACMIPRGARQVSYILHSMSEKHDLPWHRVINSQGKISLPGNRGELQQQLLEQEGVIFTKGKINLQTYSYLNSHHDEY